MLRKHKYSQEEMWNLKFGMLKLQTVMTSFPSKLLLVKHSFFTFGSVRNDDLRTEFVISYFFVLFDRNRERCDQIFWHFYELS